MLSLYSPMVVTLLPLMIVFSALMISIVSPARSLFATWLERRPRIICSASITVVLVLSDIFLPHNPDICAFGYCIHQCTNGDGFSAVVCYSCFCRFAKCECCDCDCVIQKS